MKVTDSTAKKNTISKDKARESLHMLQPSATDKENLVAAGRMLRSNKQTSKNTIQTSKNTIQTSKNTIQTPKKTKTKNVPEKTKSSPSNKPKKLSEDKAVQTARGEKIKIEVEDLTSTAGPSENYWEVLAERRQIALDDALEKIMTLEERIEKLKEQNEKLKEQKLIQEEMLKETRTLVEVLQEMIDSNDGDGNGINNSLDDSTY